MVSFYCFFMLQGGSIENPETKTCLTVKNHHGQERLLSGMMLDVCHIGWDGAIDILYNCRGLCRHI